MAIQQHPLPQDISSYRFRLIGDMTIKQFAFLAGFIIVGVIFYSSPLPFFFKYPLAFISVCLGIGIAFVPVQGRPLEQWIIAFIKSIYSPTQYIWRQSNVEANQPTHQPTAQEQIQAKSLNLPTPQTQTTQVQAQPQVTPIAVATPAPVAIQATTPTVTATSAPIQPTPTQITSTPPQPKQPFTQQTAPQAAPATMPVELPKPAASSPVPSSSSAAAPTVNLPIPFTPTTQNTLVGLTLTPDGKILDNVMVEIQSKGLTIRATRSNRLGQFMFARPLENGLYQIIADKEGSKFAIYSLDLKGEIVKPLKIQAEK